MKEPPLRRKVPNPWPDLCTVNGDIYSPMGARTLIMAMRWGAPSTKLTSEAKELLDEYSAWLGMQKKQTEKVKSLCRS
jgi:hypothetical protein